jgi:hypothetical protein
MFTTAGDATLIMGASEGSATATPPAEADGGIHEADRVMRRRAATMTLEADRKRISVVSRVRILYQRPGRGALRYDGRKLPHAQENAALNHRRLMRGSFT